MLFMEQHVFYLIPQSIVIASALLNIQYLL
jgi:hypothetical protein